MIASATWTGFMKVCSLSPISGSRGCVTHDIPSSVSAILNRVSVIAANRFTLGETYPERMYPGGGRDGKLGCNQSAVNANGLPRKGCICSVAVLSMMAKSSSSKTSKYRLNPNSDRQSETYFSTFCISLHHRISCRTLAIPGLMWNRLHPPLHETKRVE